MSGEGNSAARISPDLRRQRRPLAALRLESP